jgi:hypothetical protein
MLVLADEMTGMVSVSSLYRMRTSTSLSAASQANWARSRVSTLRACHKSRDCALVIYYLLLKPRIRVLCLNFAFELVSCHYVRAPVCLDNARTMPGLARAFCRVKNYLDTEIPLIWYKGWRSALDNDVASCPDMEC